MAVNRFGNKAPTESIVSYRKVAEVINDPQKSIAEKQKFAAAFAKKLPPAPRAKLLQRLSVISRMKTEQGQQKRLDGFLKQSDRVLTDFLQRELVKKVRKNTKGLKKRQDRVARGRGPAFERELALAKKDVNGAT